MADVYKQVLNTGAEDQVFRSSNKFALGYKKHDFRKNGVKLSVSTSDD